MKLATPTPAPRPPAFNPDPVMPNVPPPPAPLADRSAEAPRSAIPILIRVAIALVVILGLIAALR